MKTSKELAEEHLELSALEMINNSKISEIMKQQSVNIIDFRKSNPFEENEDYNLYVPEKQQLAIKELMNQYYYKNKNVVFRKLSEYMNINVFYKKRM